ncbi:response regulator, partial [Enterococcus faecium]|uniref:response regulator n=1 Tax=Enterococcus faecium TaxID=1352 RepID=UPI0039FC3BC9
MTENRSAGQVVLVEDDPVIREATIMGLERFGYSVTSYADGLQALDAVLAQPPEVLLLDVMLPGLNGVSICGKVREKFLIP